MRRAPVFALLLLLPLAITGCDDGGGNPHLFSLTLEVVDGDGAPLEGLQVSLVSDLPYYYDEKINGPKPAVSIPFTAALPCSVHLMIEDVYGEPVRLLLAQGSIPAGQYTVQWNGLDGVGAQQASGVYKTHLRCFDDETGELLFDDSADMYMAIIDPARMSVGVTDTEGRLEITDKRLFPHLCDAPDITARDETAEAIGTISFTDAMRIGLHDPVQGAYGVFYRDVAGPGTLELVWNPGKVDAGSDAPILRATRSEPEDPPPPVFSVGPPYPIPFN